MENRLSKKLLAKFGFRAEFARNLIALGLNPGLVCFIESCVITLPAAAAEPAWQYGAAIDVSYANAFQSDRALNWRSKATTQRLNAFAPNMGMLYLRKPADEGSRWGVEIGTQAGYDTDGQVPSQQRLPGYSVLRYVSRANLSYLAPIGNGLTLSGGLMNSFIGFESSYAKDNFNYTRAWIADYSPYYLIGIGAQYPFNQHFSGGFYLLSDYDYLAYRNSQPKYGSQVVWTIDGRWKLTQNLFAGPEQNNVDTRYWRYFSDTVLQWADDSLTLALAYDVGTEKLDISSEKQALWMGTALFGRWHIGGPWSVAIRPELYWDSDGRMTGSRQLVKATTATVEYKVSWDYASLAFRTEYRFDKSDGQQGGFFRSRNSDLDLVGEQHLALFSCLLTFDKR